MNLLYSWEWHWIIDPPASSSQILGLQVFTYPWLRNKLHWAIFPGSFIFLEVGHCYQHDIKSSILQKEISPAEVFVSLIELQCLIKHHDATVTFFSKQRWISSKLSLLPLGGFCLHLYSWVLEILKSGSHGFFF